MEERPRTGALPGGDRSRDRTRLQPVHRNFAAPDPVVLSEGNREAGVGPRHCRFDIAARCRRKGPGSDFARDGARHRPRRRFRRGPPVRQAQCVRPASQPAVRTDRTATGADQRHDRPVRPWRPHALYAGRLARRPQQRQLEEPYRRASVPRSRGAYRRRQGDPARQRLHRDRDLGGAAILRHG